MALGITTICVSIVMAAIYVVVRLMTGNLWGALTGLLATFSYIAAAVLALFLATDITGAYIFILLALIISMVGDVLIELKDDKNEQGAFLVIGMVVFATGRILNLIALTYLVAHEIAAIPFIISGVIAIAITAIILVGAKMLKLEFKALFGHTLCYFLITTYIATLAFWYIFIVPFTLLFGVAMVTFLISDMILLEMHLGSQKGKDTVFVLHNFFYFASQLLIVSFIYFVLFLQ